MVVGLFEDTSDAEIALNNLTEAEFDSSKLSVVSQEQNIAHKISDCTGTYTGYSIKSLLSALRKLGLPKSYKGQIFIIVETQNTEESSAAKEIMESENAVFVTILQK